MQFIFWRGDEMTNKTANHIDGCNEDCMGTWYMGTWYDEEAVPRECPCHAKKRVAKAGFTPGPLRVLAGPPAYAKIVDQAGRTLARLYRDDVPDLDENDANAVLFAGAPDLLEALLDAPDPNTLFPDDLVEAYQLWHDGQRQAAIAKAEGREP